MLVLSIRLLSPLSGGAFLLKALWLATSFLGRALRSVTNRVPRVRRGNVPSLLNLAGTMYNGSARPAIVSPFFT